MVAVGLLFVHMLCDRFKSRWRLGAEILILRHRAPAEPEALRNFLVGAVAGFAVAD